MKNNEQNIKRYMRKNTFWRYSIKKKSIKYKSIERVNNTTIIKNQII